MLATSSRTLYSPATSPAALLPSPAVIPPSPVAVHADAAGELYVFVSSSNVIWVGHERPERPPLGLGYTLDSPRERNPEHTTMAFTVHADEDGVRRLTHKIYPHQSFARDAVMDRAGELAEAFVNDHADYLDELRVVLINDRIAENEWMKSKVPFNVIGELIDEQVLGIEKRMEGLPEPWLSLLRDLDFTCTDLTTAPAPLGPLVVSNEPKTNLEAYALRIAYDIRHTACLVKGQAERVAEYDATNTTLREWLERETSRAPAAPGPR